jgi:hypothetical protein
MSKSSETASTQSPEPTRIAIDMDGNGYVVREIAADLFRIPRAVGFVLC